MEFAGAGSSSDASYAIFGSTEMVEALELMAAIAVEAERSAIPEIGPLLRQMLRELEGELVALSRRTAGLADNAIVRHIRATQVRPETTKSLHLEDCIVSVPFPFGTVKIALIDELEKATNPWSGGAYWRTQEYGSVAVGNTMTGRVLYGRFAGPSHDDVPRNAFAGGGGPGSEFLGGTIAAMREFAGGDEGGYGTVEHEDQPRHFLQMGMDEAALAHGEAITQLSVRYAARIAALKIDRLVL
jgi:hypothetical protein